VIVAPRPNGAGDFQIQIEKAAPKQLRSKETEKLQGKERLHKIAVPTAALPVKIFAGGRLA